MKKEGSSNSWGHWLPAASRDDFCQKTDTLWSPWEPKSARKRGAMTSQNFESYSAVTASIMRPHMTENGAEIDCFRCHGRRQGDVVVARVVYCL